MTVDERRKMIKKLYGGIAGFFLALSFFSFSLPPLERNDSFIVHITVDSVSDCIYEIFIVHTLSQYDYYTGSYAHELMLWNLLNKSTSRIYKTREVPQ